MNRKIALVHDWLTGMRGGEKVLEVFCELFPKADIVTLLHVPGQVSRVIESHRIITSPLQHIPRISAYYRNLLPFMPWAMESLDFSGYDLLISTSHCVAKAARPAKGARHVCYCFTPMRYIWDQYDSYFAAGRASWPTRMIMQMLRPALQRWDLGTLSHVNEFISDCRNIRERILRIYGRNSVIIYPPVDFEFYSVPSPQPSPASRGRGGILGSPRPPKAREGIFGSPRPPKAGEGEGEGKVEPFYLIVSALAPYKNVDLAIETFRKLGKRLVIIGEGQESRKLRHSAGPHIAFLGWRSNEELRLYYQSARALVFPGEEDFGIVPVEAMAAGCPVIALGKGGALETVVNEKTGLFFGSATVDSLSEAIARFESMRFDPHVVRDHARTFSRDRCDDALRSYFVEYRDEMS